MREVLQQLAQIPGVVGSLACTRQGELLASAFPPLFDELTLHRVAGILADDTAGISKLAGPGGSFDLRFARGRAVVRPFRSGTLFVLGTSAADAQLLGMSVEQALRRLDEAPESASPVARERSAGPDPAAAREGLRQALIREIGPFGEIAFDEAWAAWSAAGTGMEELVARLEKEIDDPEALARFRSGARPLLG